MSKYSMIDVTKKRVLLPLRERCSYLRPRIYYLVPLAAIFVGCAGSGSGEHDVSTFTKDSGAMVDGGAADVVSDGDDVSDGAQSDAVEDTCENGEHDRRETDVDCGGICTTQCAEGLKCEISRDCVAVCDPTSKICEPANVCGNGIVEVGESCDDGANDDDDGCTASCRGESLPPGALCYLDDECASSYCIANHCLNRSADHIRAPATGTLRFGESSALLPRPDGSVLVAVGASAQSLGADKSHAGAVHLFTVSGAGVWQTGPILQHSINEFGHDFFGTSVEFIVLADKTILLAVGATGADGSGSVHIYREDSGGFIIEKTLKPSNPGDTDAFGGSVSLLELPTGETVLAVGAQDEDSDDDGVEADGVDDDAEDSGAVYTYLRSAAGVWRFEKYLKATNSDKRDHFGVDVALANAPSGEVILAVGAPGEGSDATGVGGEGEELYNGSGAVYMYRRLASGSWQFEEYIKGTTTGELRFGQSIDLLTLADRRIIVAIGAPGEGTNVVDGKRIDHGARSSGAVFTYERNAGGMWKSLELIKAHNIDIGDDFGTSVTLISSSNGDLLLGVGAVDERSDEKGLDGRGYGFLAQKSGAAYLFESASGSTFMQRLYAKAPNTGRDDSFGYSMSGVITVDGNFVWSIGAVKENSASVGINGPGRDDPGHSLGANYIYRALP